jgi:hypothetical protein
MTTSQAVRRLIRGGETEAPNADTSPARRWTSEKYARNNPPCQYKCQVMPAGDG